VGHKYRLTESIRSRSLNPKSARPAPDVITQGEPTAPGSEPTASQAAESEKAEGAPAPTAAAEPTAEEFGSTDDSAGAYVAIDTKKLAFGLPALVRPEGPGYMPLYLAAQWIATRGGTIDIDPRDIMIWKDAFATLLARMASEEVAVVGIRDGKNEKIDGHLFAAIQVDYPHSDTPFSLLVSEDLFLSSCPYLDDDHWRKGFDDHLETRSGVKWSRLTVSKADIARWWPFDIAKSADVTPSVTGAPGRPTSMHLVELEYRDRWQRGEAKPDIGAEANALAEWLRTEHPDAPQLTPKTIANRLRHEHRRRVGDAQK
jgi:hypothetical protein